MNLKYLSSNAITSQMTLNEISDSKIIEVAKYLRESIEKYCAELSWPPIIIQLTAEGCLQIR